MTDEAPDIEPDTPDNAAPENEGDAANSPEAVVDWRQMYESLRPEFDRRNEELKEAQAQAQLVAALRSDDPEQRRWAAEELGLEYEDPDLYDDTPNDPLDELRTEITTLKEQWESERKAAEAEAAAEQEAFFAADELKAVGLNPEVDEDAEVAQFVLANAYANRDEQGRPDVRAAYDRYQRLLDQHAKGVFQGKKAPHVAAGGQSATQQPDLDNDKARQEWMIQQLRGQSNT
jgi:hypothetical protein